MAGRTPVLTWRTLAALRATLANSSELAPPFPGRFSGADAPCATICTRHMSFQPSELPLCPKISLYTCMLLSEALVT